MLFSHRAFGIFLWVNISLDVLSCISYQSLGRVRKQTVQKEERERVWGGPELLPHDFPSPKEPNEEVNYCQSTETTT